MNRTTFRGPSRPEGGHYVVSAEVHRWTDPLGGAARGGTPQPGAPVLVSGNITRWHHVAPGNMIAHGLVMRRSIRIPKAAELCSPRLYSKGTTSQVPHLGPPTRTRDQLCGCEEQYLLGIGTGEPPGQPRGCGERRVGFLGNMTSAGPMPHARGPLDQDRRVDQPRGTNPACAGTTQRP